MTPPAVRPAARGDVPAMLSVYAGYIGTPVTFELEPPSEEEFAARMGPDPAYPWLVYDDGGVAGYAYARRLKDRAAYDWCAETSVYVDAGRRGEGVGSALYSELLSLLGAQGVRSALACVTVPNPESEGFHEAMGFERVGLFEKAGYKLGAWRDVAWYRLELSGGDGEPGPLRPWTRGRRCSCRRPCRTSGPTPPGPRPRRPRCGTCCRAGSARPCAC